MLTRDHVHPTEKRINKLHKQQGRPYKLAYNRTETKQKTTTTRKEKRHKNGTPTPPRRKENRGQQQATYSCLTTVSTASFIASATRCTVDVVKPAMLIRPLLVM